MGDLTYKATRAGDQKNCVYIEKYFLNAIFLEIENKLLE